MINEIQLLTLFTSAECAFLWLEFKSYKDMFVGKFSKEGEKKKSDFLKICGL